MGKEASMEEMGFDDVPIAAVRDWLLSVTDFTVRRHTARLVYAHPYGAEKFFPTLRFFLDNADSLQKQRLFRWYTMTDLANFLNQRQQVHWELIAGQAGKVILRASQSATLAHETWVFPQARYQDARVIEGQATVRVQDGLMFIVAADCHDLKVELTEGPQTKSALEAKR
jgi:hypothetical protein